MARASAARIARNKINAAAYLGAGVIGRPSTVRRAAVMGTLATNIKDNSGGAQYAWHSNYPMFSPFDIEAGTEIEAAVPLYTLERANGSAPILETMLSEAYDFQAAIELPGGQRLRLQCNGQDTYSYVVGTTDVFVVFKATAPVTIPAMTAFYGHLVHECVAGRSGAVVNKMIRAVNNAASMTGRPMYGRNETGSLIASNSVMTRTSFQQANLNGLIGLNSPMTFGAIKITMPSGKMAVISDGNSIAQGANNGTDRSQGNGVVYGSAFGDRYGNAGAVGRAARMLGAGVTNISKGSDRDNYRLVTDNMKCRRAFGAWCNPNGYIDMDPHNDVGGAGTSNWAATTAYALDDVVFSNGNAYICDRAGTTGSAAIGGTGKDIADGTALWTYIGPNDMGSGGPGWVGQRRRRLRGDWATYGPDCKFFGVTCTPDGTSTRVASAYTYDASTGDVVATLPNVADLVVGGFVRLSGTSLSQINTSGISNAVITAIDTTAKTITVRRGTGGGTPTGTLTVNTTWSSPEGQQPSTNFTAGNSNRSWINRFLRTNPHNVLRYTAILDIGRALEQGNPATPAAETGRWISTLEDGLAKGSNMTSDGVHPTSWGDEVAAVYVANDNLVRTAFGLAA